MPCAAPQPRSNTSVLAPSAVRLLALKRQQVDVMHVPHREASDRKFPEELCLDLSDRGLSFLKMS
jgi:hypothetical protein